MTEGRDVEPETRCTHLKVLVNGAEPRHTALNRPEPP
jgi:hypothetical protein